MTSIEASRLQQARTVHTYARADSPLYKVVSRAYLRHVGRTLLAITQDDKEVAVKLVAVMGALGIGALLVLLGIKMKTRQGSAS